MTVQSEDRRISGGRIDARTEDTRVALIAAAERLFSVRGIGAVSMREISREAGQRNTNSLGYHFRDRQGILTAVVSKHVRDIDRYRHALLDHFETTAERSLRPLLTALVLPIASKLRDPDGGPEYLQIAAELMNRPERERQADPISVSHPGGSMARWGELAIGVAPDYDEISSPSSRRVAVVRFVYLELGRRAREEQAGEGDPAATSWLIDQAAALYTVEASTDTKELHDGAVMRGNSSSPD
jgi:AcrR family transcriptional regulator